MTKTLSLNTTSIKFSDDKTDLIFTASKDGQIITSNIAPTLKIKQLDKGYLTSIVGKWSDGHIVVSSSSLNKLPVGQYLVELWLSDATGDDIYPDTGFIRLGINQNSTGLTGDLVSSITLQDFQSQFNDLSTEILNNLPEGKQGIQGVQGIQGIQGVQGGAGKDFSISKTFSSVASMTGDGLNEGDFVMISSTIEDPDNAKLYLWNGTGFTFVTDMSGATGIKGDKGEQGIQGVQGIHGVKGADAVITVISQADYNALTDKSGVYFIGG